MRRLTPAIILAALALAGHSAQGQNSDPLPTAQIAAVDTAIVPGARDFLEPAAPSPFGESGTIIAFSLAQEGPVRLRILDFFYGLIATPLDEVHPAGRVEISFVPPGTMSSGMYFIELRTERGVQQRRMLYVR